MFGNNDDFSWQQWWGVVKCLSAMSPTPMNTRSASRTVWSNCSSTLALACGVLPHCLIMLFAMDMLYGLPEKRFNEEKSFFRDVVFVWFNLQTFLCIIEVIYFMIKINIHVVLFLFFFFLNAKNLCSFPTWGQGLALPNESKWKSKCIMHFFFFFQALKHTFLFYV